jgi:hypothetical protein
VGELLGQIKEATMVYVGVQENVEGSMIRIGILYSLAADNEVADIVGQNFHLTSVPQPVRGALRPRTDVCRNFWYTQGTLFDCSPSRYLKNLIYVESYLI